MNDSVGVASEAIKEGKSNGLACGYPEGYAAGTEGGEYLVIDISGGHGARQYPVSYIDAPPEGGWGREFKTDKLVFRLITPCAFEMGSDSPLNRDNPPHSVELSHPYYMSVFPITNGQWLNVMGGDMESLLSRRMAWETVEEDEYEDRRLWTMSDYGDAASARGELDGERWPKSAKVPRESLVGVLRRKTGIGNIDLPTEAEWEFACKWRGYDRFCYQDGDDDGNSRAYRGWGEVGCGKPNGWGLYDMCSGNAWEFCVDKYARLHDGKVVDPAGGEDTAVGSILKGGVTNVGLGCLTSSAELRLDTDICCQCESDVDEWAIRLCITLGSTVDKARQASEREAGCEIWRRFYGFGEWSELEIKEWTSILSHRPDLADKCDWGKLDGRDWVSLLNEQPQFADRCDWEKLDRTDWWNAYFILPEFVGKFDWEKLSGKAWCGLLVSWPRFADECDWDKLSGEDWCKLLASRPEFADKCDWDKLDDEDWSLLLAEQPQFAKFKPGN